jgi:hypothetical protein
MPVDRSSARNVKLFISDEPKPIGGLVVDRTRPHITNADFLDCLLTLIVADVSDDQVASIESPPYRVIWHNVESSQVETLSDLNNHNTDGIEVAEDESLVQPGVYVVHSLRLDGK